ncbi:hypothetical protein HHI36_017273 [Cryptolaemus montrouzieri]|uniref:Uncharacterized protein n=1 Tax=Cryptolaemus montrouzieri TaxID=559131 RepID=A0ABD2NMG1_9CUCU
MVQIKKTTTKRKAWVTDGLLKSIAYKIMIKSRFDEGAGIKYRKYRNALNELLKKRKNDYFREQVSKHKHEHKQGGYGGALRGYLNGERRMTGSIISKWIMETF